jgi:hypothetical protein
MNGTPSQNWYLDIRPCATPMGAIHRHDPMVDCMVGRWGKPSTPTLRQAHSSLIVLVRVLNSHATFLNCRGRLYTRTLKLHITRWACGLKLKATDAPLHGLYRIRADDAGGPFVYWVFQNATQPQLDPKLLGGSSNVIFPQFPAHHSETSSLFFFTEN